MKIKKSEKIIANLQAALKNADRAVDPLACWQVDKLGVKYSEEQKTEMHQAGDLLYQARKKVKAVYAQIIGAQIISEIESGDWRSARRK